MQTEKLRIAFATPEYVTEKHFDGGLGNYLARVTKALAERGHDVHVVTLSHTNTETFAHEGVMVHRVRLSRRYGTLLHRLTLRRLGTVVHWLNLSTQVYLKLKKLDSQKPFHLVQVPNYSYCGLLSILLLRIPHVLRASADEPFFHDAMKERTLDFKLLNLMEKLQIRRSPYIYAPSRGLQQLFIKRDRLSRVRLIHKPMYLEAVDWDEDVYDRMMKGKEYLLFFGRFERRKGTQILIEALGRTLEEHREMHAVLIGRDVATAAIPSMFEYARSLCGRFGNRLMLMDSLPHRRLYPVIANARLVVLPSVTDNMPNACLEAMALGKPVIGTREAGFGEVITDEETGFLVTANDVAALSEKIGYAWNHPRLVQIGHAARERMQEFAPEKTIPPLLSYYREILQ